MSLEFGTPREEIREVTQLIVNGKRYDAYVGESLLGFLFQNRIFSTSVNLVTKEVRFAFCGMGMCSECEMIDENGSIIRICQTSIRRNMTLTSRGI
jgi:predicted molibdopterin-dependent oxidoreductase YjgC